METQQLIQLLNKCKSACEICADACLAESDLAHMEDCIRSCKVCASICATSSSMLATSYQNVSPLLNYCIQVCEDCAKNCKEHSHEHCQKCAESCEECAKNCNIYLETIQEITL